ncbi:MAG TPA: hypothetical protein VF704_04215 [Allosphingosinicella sp.]|jgi:hypothetical protein
MAREPSYPEDAPVGEPAGDEPAKNEGAEEKDEGSNRTPYIVAGAAIGIGSAALVAALLYANRSRKGPDKPRGPARDAED